MQNVMEFDRSEAQTAYVVIIEWDGEQPPSTWYARMHSLAGKVRGDKDISPLQRREGKGVIAQEGCIICPSYSLALMLALLARDEFGAVSVQLGEAEVSTTFSASKADHEVLRRIGETLGKRGRRPNPNNYVVTCLEEMTVSEMNDIYAIQCPHCHGMRVHSRIGSVVEYQDDGADIVELWGRTRFAGPHWEPAPVVDAGGIVAQPMDKTEVFSKRESRAVGQLFAANAVSDYVRGMSDRAEAMRILDAVFVARCYHDTDQRLKRRVRVATDYFRNGGDASKIILDAGQPEPDLLDTASVFSPAESLYHVMESLK